MLSAAQMREADRRCIEEIGIPGAVLMNNAGTAVYRELPPGSVGIVCGTGNNGGDGFVVARLALLGGRAVETLLVGDPARVRGDALTFMKVFTRLGGSIRVVHDTAEAEKIVAGLAHCGVLVDALLGTGASGEVRGPIRAAIEAWPAAPHTVAVDLPSGLDADTGAILGACIRAHTTVTFQFAKPGLFQPGARPFVGRLVIADIGIPEICAPSLP
jgi:NAD(P)H-hydrate epimerase